MHWLTHAEVVFHASIKSRVCLRGQNWLTAFYTYERTQRRRQKTGWKFSTRNALLDDRQRIWLGKSVFHQKRDHQAYMRFYRWNTTSTYGNQCVTLDRGYRALRGYWWRRRQLLDRLFNFPVRHRLVRPSWRSAAQNTNLERISPRPNWLPLCEYW